jgi:hypothetical protein
MASTLGPFLAEDEFKIPDELIQTALSSFSVKRMRNQDGGPDSVMGRDVERGGRQITYETQLPVNSFILPDDVFSLSLEEKWEFVEQKATSMAGALLHVLSSQPYLLTLKNVVSESFFTMMTKPKNGPSYQSFMSDCKVVIARMDNTNNFNSHVVLEDSKSLTALMFHHALVPGNNNDTNSTKQDEISDNADNNEDDNDGDDDDDDDDSNDDASDKNNEGVTEFEDDNGRNEHANKQQLSTCQ